MSQYRISCRTVTKLLRNATKRIELGKHELFTPPQVQQNYFISRNWAGIIDFIQFARSCNIQITESVLQHKALIIRDDLCEAMDDKECDLYKRLSRFTASIGWLQKLVRRNTIRSVSLHAEGGSASPSLMRRNEYSEVKIEWVWYRLHIYCQRDLSVL